VVINRLNEFFSSERWMLNRWQLPLAGLLVAAGLVATVSTLQAAAPQKQKQTAKSPVAASALPIPVLQQQELEVNSTTTASISPTLTPEQQNLTIDSTSVTPTVSQAAPQQQELTLDSTSAAPRWESDAPQQQEEPAVDLPTVAPALKPAPPQKVAASHKPGKTVDSVASAMPSAKWMRQAQAAHKGTIAQAPTSDAVIPDGMYLYGKSPQPGQTGKEYLVFEAHQGKVFGALYLPNSEYSCFSGTLDSRQMNLTVANAYDQTAVSHTIARAQPAHIAAVGGSINLENTYDSLTYPHTVQLDGYQPISQISDNDKKILNSCRSNP
jgi:hypothetical protein